MPREKVKNIDMQRIGRIVSNAMFMGVPCLAVALWVPVLLGVPIALLIVAVLYVNLRADAFKKRILWQNETVVNGIACALQRNAISNVNPANTTLLQSVYLT